MPHFRLNLRKDRITKKHEVHRESCTYYAELKEFLELGNSLFCSTALDKARDMGIKNIDGCKFCCTDCHDQESTTFFQNSF